MKKCIYCGLTKVRIKSDKRRCKYSYYFVDDKGRRWNGFSCPDCTSTREPKREVKVRLCKGCNKPLPVTKYFRHEECTVVDEDCSISEDYIYAPYSTSSF